MYILSSHMDKAWIWSLCTVRPGCLWARTWTKLNVDTNSLDVHVSTLGSVDKVHIRRVYKYSERTNVLCQDVRTSDITIITTTTPEKVKKNGLSGRPSDPTAKWGRLDRIPHEQWQIEFRLVVPWSSSMPTFHLGRAAYHLGLLRANRGGYSFSDFCHFMFP